MRRAAAVLLLLSLLAGTAAAATIRGTVHADRVMSAFGGADRVTCGPGRDYVAADLADRVARDCEVVSRRLSVDTFGESESQHETSVEPASASFGASIVAVFQVGRFTSGGSSGIGFATSRDAGRTWTRGILPGLGRSSDPVVAYDPVHAAWLASALSIEAGAGKLDVSVVVFRSTDGVHWSQPIEVHPGPDDDKEWLACDGGAASPFRGRCYDVYTDDGAHRISSQYSDDGGLTWSAPVRVTSDLIGTQPLVRPDGSLHVVAADANSRVGSIASIRSTDGGATFSPAVRVSNIQWRPPTGLRSFPLPSAVAQPDGTLDVVWHDCRFRAGCTANDLVISSSPDGVTWSDPERIPLAAPSSSADFFIPGLGADPSRPGRLALDYFFYVAGSCERGGCLLGVGLTSSSDGGRTWRTPTRLDVSPYALPWLANTGDGRMVGDYIATSFANGRAVPVFTLARKPLGGRYREAIFASSLPVP